MDINAFLTQQNIQTSSSKNGSQGGKDGFFAAAPGENFMDLMMTNMGKDSVTTRNAQDALSTDIPTIKETILRNINQTIETAEEQGIEPLAALEDLAKRINNKFGTDFTAEDLMNLANRANSGNGLAQFENFQSKDKLLELAKITSQDAATSAQNALSSSAQNSDLNDFVNHLLRSIPESSRPEVIEISAEDVQTALDNLEFDPSSDGSIPALIATNLTPEELNALITDIQKQAEDGQALVVGMVKITPDEEDTIFVPSALLMPQQRLQQLDAANKNAGLTTNGEDMDGLAAQLNALVVGSGNETNGGGLSGKPQTLGDMLRMMQNQQTGNDNTPVPVDPDAPLGKQTATSDPNLQRGDTPQLGERNPTLSLSLNQSGDFNFNSQSFTDFLNSSFDFFQAGFSTPGATITGPGSVAGLVTQTQHAGHPHPGTQALAAQITRAATNGDNQNITINMRPAELGRVQVQLEFSADSKKVKTHITVEKAETFAMLQRDAHLLERALQDSGVDFGNSDLSFELSQDGNLFDQDPNGRGQNDAGGSSGSSDGEGEEMEIIETTVDWFVDPDTGLTRYNILA